MLPPLTDAQREALRAFIDWVQSLQPGYALCESDAIGEWNTYSASPVSADEWIAAFEDYRHDPVWNHAPFLADRRPAPRPQPLPQPTER